MTNSLLPMAGNPPEIKPLGRVFLTDIIPPEDGTPPTPDLLRHIREFGIIEPLTLAKRPRSKRWIIVSGRRRFRAAVILLHESAPAQEIILPEDDAQAALVLAMNRLRSKNPVADTRAAAVLFAAGRSDAEIREATGLTAGEIKKLRALAVCDGRLLRHVADGRCTTARALKIAKLPVEAQQALLNGFDSELSENAKARLSAGDVAEARSVALRETAVVMPPSLFTSVEEIEARVAEDACRAKAARPARETLEWIVAYADVLTPAEIAAEASRALAAGGSR